MQELKTKLLTSQLTDDGSRSSLQDVSVKRSADVGSEVVELKITKRKNVKRRDDVVKHTGIEG